MGLIITAQGLYDSWMDVSPLLDFPPPPQVFGGQSIWDVLPLEVVQALTKPHASLGKKANEKRRSRNRFSSDAMCLQVSWEPEQCNAS